MRIPILTKYIETRVSAAVDLIEEENQLIVKKLQREHEKNLAVSFEQGHKAGRDYEFRTMNDHLEGMFKAKMTANVEWVVNRFRESVK